MKYVIMVFVVLMFGNAKAEVGRLTQNYDSANQQERVAEMENNPVLKITRRSLKNNNDIRTARNLLLLQQVLEYRMNSEQLHDDFDEVEQSLEYHKALEKIMKQLNNKKLQNNKNKEVTRILNEAGNKIYNLLAN